MLGRTGPDISINELGLVIDVKSRLSVPKGYVLPDGFVYAFDGLLAVTLYHMGNLLWCGESGCPEGKPSVQVQRWFEHMDEWRRDHYEDGITALVLHRPGMPYDQSTFLIHADARRKFYDRCIYNGVSAGSE